MCIRDSTLVASFTDWQPTGEARKEDSRRLRENMQHSMVTRYKAKQGTEDNKGEEMEMMEEIIEETIKEDTQGDQPENPTQPEPEVIIGNQPEKPSQDREREQQAGDTV